MLVFDSNQRETDALIPSFDSIFLVIVIMKLGSLDLNYIIYLIKIHLFTIMACEDNSI